MATDQDLRDAFEKFKREEFAPVRDSWVEWHGAWKLVTGAATVLAIVATFFGLLAYFGMGAK